MTGALLPDIAPSGNDSFGHATNANRLLTQHSGTTGGFYNRIQRTGDILHDLKFAAPTP